MIRLQRVATAVLILKLPKSTNALDSVFEKFFRPDKKNDDRRCFPTNCFQNLDRCIYKVKKSFENLPESSFVF